MNIVSKYIAKIGVGMDCGNKKDRKHLPSDLSHSEYKGEDENG